MIELIRLEKASGEKNEVMVTITTEYQTISIGLEDLFTAAADAALTLAHSAEMSGPGWSAEISQ